MKTKLLKKLRAKAAFEYRVIMISKVEYFVCRFSYMLTGRSMLIQKAKTFEEAKKMCDSLRRYYILELCEKKRHDLEKIIY